jgi:KDO2-lipid IV(A) lauroyltransferase
VDFTPSGDDDEDIAMLTAAITAKIEEIVREDPGQWLWIHQRWSTARDIELMKGRG